ncbi:MAG: HD domain-containing protein [Treponema sp.]|jgi:HD superfamily phosphohydrolase|nr:HD domain-containing protein [Treponema sp.]
MDAGSFLREAFTIPLRDPLWGHIYMTEGIAALTETKAFMRLGRIFQLGPACRVYPGATHTRFGHSIGVYHLARRLLTGLAEQSGALISRQGAFSFLAAALLHDLGHFPYTHSLKEIALRDHESLSAGLIRAEPQRSLVAKAGGDPELCAAIIDKTAPAGSGELLFYRRLLSGVLDPDKLDYLNRDARYCGVPYGDQDVDFIFSRLIPHPLRGVDIDSRGIPGVEALLFSKYLMYRNVYWHRQVRSATAMIKKALCAGLDAKIIRGDDLYGLDDQELFALMGKKNFAPFELAAQVRGGRLFYEAAAFPYTAITGLDSIAARSEKEALLAGRLQAELGKNTGAPALIIDVPESVSFETDLFVRDEGVAFGESSSAFKKNVLDAFVGSLRIVRVFTKEPLAQPGPQGAGIAQKILKMLA